MFPREILRPDAMAKLSGRPGYLSDLREPGALFGAVLRSPHPHARIVSIDTSKATALPGVHAVLTDADVRPGFSLGIRIKDQPVLARGFVRCVGDPVAAVAADTREHAIAALDAIAVRYDVLPLVDDPERALSPGAPPLHPGGNLCHATAYSRGDLAAAFARAVHVVDDRYHTPCQMHVALELDGGLAVLHPDGRLTVNSPSQHPHGVRELLCQMLDWPSERIEVNGSPLGGAYGGKEDVHVQPLLALLAVKAGRSVRMLLTRPETVDCSIKRHPFQIRMRTGCDAEGFLLAHEVDALADTGAYASHGPEVLDTAHENAQGPYRFEAVSLRGRLAYTNNGIAGAFRGFGALQIQMALELQVTRLARLCGMDPIAFRKRNLRAADARGPLDQTIAAQPELSVVLDRMASHPMPRTSGGDRPARYRVGTGASFVTKGEGFGATRGKVGGHGLAAGPNAAAAVVTLTPDGIEYRCALAEMGQGAAAAMTAALARELGVAHADIRAVVGSTCGAPDAGPTSASRGTQVAVRLARAASPPLRTALLAKAAGALGCAVDRLSLGPGGVYIDGVRRNAPAIGFETLAQGEIVSVAVTMDPIESADGAGPAHKLYSACGALARVAVDTLTGRVTAEHIVMVPACGPVLAPDAFVGQVEGCAVMACGFVLTESLPMREGRYLARNLDSYLVPTLQDAPVVTVDPVEELAPDDPVGVRGVGEIPMNAAGPAIAAAVFDALGKVPTRFPIDPRWVLDVIAKKAGA